MDSKKIVSNQEGPHDNLIALVKKHLSTQTKRPIADHSLKAFEKVSAKLSDYKAPLVLDSCCGTGQSSRHFASEFPDHWVVGVDKSENRLSREHGEDIPENLIMVRSDLTDFYRLAHEANLQLDRHYLLYPNPWPKSGHLKRRWHGMSVFPDILALGGEFEMRTNWDIYAEELVLALETAGFEAELRSYDAQHPITAHEKKYADSGHDLWRVVAKLD